MGTWYTGKLTDPGLYSENTPLGRAQLLHVRLSSAELSVCIMVKMIRENVL